MRKTLSLLAALATALPLVLAAPVPSSAAARPAAASSVVIKDLTVTIHGTPVSLYVVAPARHRAHANAGILFLHWFAPGTVGADQQSETIVWRGDIP